MGDADRPSPGMCFQSRHARSARDRNVDSTILKCACTGSREDPGGGIYIRYFIPLHH